MRQRRNTISAIADFTKAIELDPKSGAAYAERGNCYFSLRDNIRASADLTAAINLETTNADYLYRRGTIFDDELDFDLALADYDHALALRPDFELAQIHRKIALHNRDNSKRRQSGEPMNLVSKALNLQSKHDYDGALTACLQATEIDPEFLLGYVTLGSIYLNKSDYGRAITAYTEALKIDPRLSGVYLNRSVAHRSRLEFDNAIADLDQAIKLRPDDSTGWYDRGYTRYLQGDFTRAITDFTEVIQPDAARRRSPGFDDYDPLANGIVMINLDPQHPFFFRAACRFRLHEYDLALTDFNEAIEQDPKDVDSYHNRASTYIKMGHKDKALADYDTALRLDPKSAVDYQDRGVTYESMGDYEKALADFNALLQISNGDLGNLDRLAWIYAACPQAKFRDGKKAVSYAMRECAASGWRAPAFVDTLAAACAETGDFKSAARWEGYCLKIPGLGPMYVPRIKDRLALYESGQPYRGDK